MSGDTPKPDQRGIEHHAARENGRNRGLVIAAPHEGFDLSTGPIAKLIGTELNVGWVVARGFRSRRRRTFVNVNRPTERPWRGDNFGAAKATPEARAIFERYVETLREAARVSGTEQLELLVEIHGHARLDARGEPLSVIEVASRGLGASRLRALSGHDVARLEELELNDAPPMYFGALKEHRQYRHGGGLERFKFDATGARSSGSLSPAITLRALHFELPPTLRHHAEAHRFIARRLSELISLAMKA
jgi:hypothetical protein